jgi:hypothetical protein
MLPPGFRNSALANIFPEDKFFNCTNGVFPMVSNMDVADILLLFFIRKIPLIFNGYFVKFGHLKPPTKQWEPKAEC